MKTLRTWAAAALLALILGASHYLDQPQVAEPTSNVVR